MSLTTQWQSLMEVLREFAPVTAASFQPGASASAIADAEAALGVVFPAELREWFSLQNGQVDPEGGYAGELLAMQEFFSLDQIVVEHASLLELSNQMLEYEKELYVSLAVMADRAPDAGTETDLFIPAYVPLSGHQNIDNFCDTRPGPRNGCIGWWPYDAGPASPTDWGSITEMVAHIENNIVDGVQDGWRIVVEDGAMYWEVDSSDTPSAPTNTFIDPGAADDPTFVVTPFWPDMEEALLGMPSADVIRSHHVPRDQSVDLIAAQNAVIEDAARRYKTSRVTAIALHGMYGGFSLPRVPGAQIDILIGIDGEIKVYRATATDEVGGFTIETPSS